MQFKHGFHIWLSGKGVREQGRLIQNAYYIYFGLTIMHIPGPEPDTLRASLRILRLSQVKELSHLDLSKAALYKL